MYNKPHPDYKISETFMYNVTTQEIVKQYLIIKFFQIETDKILGEVNISLYKVATGAKHFDYHITSPKKYLGRTSFDVKMDQMIKVEIKSTQLVVKLQDKLTEKHYFYNFSLEHCQNVIESPHSTDFENCYLYNPMVDRGSMSRSGDSEVMSERYTFPGSNASPVSQDALFEDGKELIQRLNTIESKQSLEKADYENQDMIVGNGTQS
jgi:hypothetical protein